MRIRFYLLLLLLTAGRHSANATHYRGGDLSYRSMGNGAYEITFRIYSDCHNGDSTAIAQDLPLYYAVFEGGNMRMLDTTLTGIPQSLSKNVISGCYNDTDHYCATYTELKRTLNMPLNLSGYDLVNQRCCMGTQVRNIADAGNQGLTLQCSIPGTAKLGPSGPDSGPQFNSLPPLRMCSNSTFAIDYSATDADGDSLAYRLVGGLRGGSSSNAKPNPSATFAPLAYTPKFSYLQPLGGGGVVSLNATTGLLSGRCSIGGDYLICVACDEYRNGVLIGTVMRAYVIEFANCNKETEAQLLRDSVVLQSGIDSLSIIRCGGSGRTVQFRNRSIGATSFHWDFGVAGTTDDTSAQANPEYTYPAAGAYPLTLIAYGKTCSDTLRTTVSFSDDILNADFTITGGNCLLDTVLLRDNSTGSRITEYRWQVDAGAAFGNPIGLVLLNPGPLHITHSIISEHGCVAALNKMIDVRQAAISAGSADTVVPIGLDLVLTASGGSSYNWEALAPAMLNNYVLGSATAQPITNARGRDFIYIVTGRDAQGCAGRDTVRVTVSEQSYIFVPTAFSPNGDGLNDILRAYVSGGNILLFSVYNRAGNLVFSTTNPHEGWDGRHKGQEAAMDAYYWMLKIQSGYSGHELVYSGDVALVR